MSNEKLSVLKYKYAMLTSRFQRYGLFFVLWAVSYFPFYEMFCFINQTVKKTQDGQFYAQMCAGFPPVAFPVIITFVYVLMIGCIKKPIFKNGLVIMLYPVLFLWLSYEIFEAYSCYLGNTWTVVESTLYLIVTDNYALILGSTSMILQWLILKFCQRRTNR